MVARESSAGTILRRWAIRASLAFVSVVGSMAAHATPPFPSKDAPEMRVAAIGHRLATHNVDRCPRLAPLTGMLLHARSAYPVSIREAVGERFDLGDGIGVLGVLPGSAAAQAGLAPGDEIVALAGASLADLPLPPETTAATYDRIEAFSAALVARLQNGPVMLTIRRGRSSRVVTLPTQIGCAAAVTVVPGTRPEAWSDSRYAAVTQALAEQAGDNELAFALAHEMAHVVLGHAGQPHGALVGIGIGGKRSRERERAADKLGIAMVLGAGYDPAGARALLDRFSRVNGPGFSLTHPSVSSRLKAIGEEAGRLKTTGSNSLP